MTSSTYTDPEADLVANVGEAARVEAKSAAYKRRVLQENKLRVLQTSSTYRDPEADLVANVRSLEAARVEAKSADNKLRVLQNRQEQDVIQPWFGRHLNPQMQSPLEEQRKKRLTPTLQGPNEIADRTPEMQLHSGAEFFESTSWHV